jgi:hypothetical protein
MTGEILNLRKARKARQRAGKEAEAAENRIRFGRTRAEKDAARLEQARSLRSIDGHRLGREDGDPD